LKINYHYIASKLYKLFKN